MYTFPAYLSACDYNGVLWAEALPPNTTPQQAWEICKQPEWMIWHQGKKKAPIADLVKAALLVAKAIQPEKLNGSKIPALWDFLGGWKPGKQIPSEFLSECATNAFVEEIWDGNREKNRMRSWYSPDGVGPSWKKWEISAIRAAESLFRAIQRMDGIGKICGDWYSHHEVYPEDLALLEAAKLCYMAAVHASQAREFAKEVATGGNNEIQWATVEGKQVWEPSEVHKEGAQKVAGTDLAALVRDVFPLPL